MRTFILLLVSLASIASAQSNFVLATTGCPAIHCTPHEDDLSTIVPPLSTFGMVFNDSAPSGSGSSVGCTSSATLVACKYQTAPLLKVYNAAGGIVFTSGTGGGATLSTGACVPIIGSDGSILDADEVNLVRYSPSGSTSTGGGYSVALPATLNNPTNGTSYLSPPFSCGSLKISANGQVTYMTVNGPMATFNSATGALIGSVFYPDLSGSGATATYYATNNSACMDGNRLYPVTNRIDNSALGRIYALDISGTGIAKAYSFDVTGPSSASPMCQRLSGNTNVYTDYSNGAIGLKDTGSALSQLFAVSSTSISGQNHSLNANFAGDSRGCAWMYVPQVSNHYCLDYTTGAVDFTVSTGSSFLFPGAVAAIMGCDRTVSINPANGHNIMVSCENLSGSGASYAAAIDMNAGGSALWYYQINASWNTDSAKGQFPTVQSANGTIEVAYSQVTGGVTILGTGGVAVPPLILFNSGGVIQ